VCTILVDVVSALVLTTSSSAQGKGRLEMSRTRRLLALAATATAAVVLGGAAVTWACTGQGSIMLSPASGPSGTVVTVKGTGFGANPVEVRWGSASSTSPLLGTAPSGNFAIDVKVPDAPSGVYYIVAVPTTTPEGTERAPGSAAFTVTVPVAEPTPVTPAPQPAQPQPQPQTQAVQPQQEALQQPAPAAAAQPVASPAPQSSTGQSAPAAVAAGPVAAARTSRPAATAPAPATAAPAPSPATAAADAPAVELADATTVEAPPAVTPEPLPVPEADDDAASRFGSAPVGLEDVTEADRLGAGMALGAVLLSVGLVTVLGAGLVAVSRRRRATSPRVVRR